jgi:hypothetical protein
MNKWRLPELEELQNVFDYKTGEPKKDWFYAYYYWSSTEYAIFKDYAWVIDFDNGSIDYFDKLYPYYFRCVRTKNNGSLEWAETVEQKMSWDKACKYCEGMNDE